MKWVVVLDTILEIIMMQGKISSKIKQNKEFELSAIVYNSSNESEHGESFLFEPCVFR